MSLKTFVNPGTGKVIHLGCRLPVATPPAMHFGNYRMKSLPNPPGACNYGTMASKSLASTFLNLVQGCCVIAWGAHVLGVVSSLIGQEIIVSNAQVDVQYGAIGGYVPGDPSTDNGCDPYTAMAYWMRVGWPQGVKVSGMALLDATDPYSCQDGVLLMENAGCWCALPDAWVNPFPEKSGFWWDVAGPPNPKNGHAFGVYGYTAKGMLIGEWGITGGITWAAAAKYCVPAVGGGMATLLLSDTIARGQQKAPNGFAWDSLTSDITLMGGII
jgi:hypothetical protein